MRARSVNRRRKRATTPRRRVARAVPKKRRARSYRAKTISNIGVSRIETERNQTTKVFPAVTDSDAVFPLATRRLYAFDCTAIRRAYQGGISTEPIMARNERLLATCKFVGIRYMFVLRNSDVNPIMFNYALISFKNRNYPLNSIDYPAEPYTCPTLMTDGFFREYSNSRDVNFTNSLSACQINHNPISTDQYVVHMHKRRLLGPLPTSTGWTGEVHENFTTIKGFFKVNRIIRFNDDDTDECETPVYMVYWCDRMHGAPDSVPVLSAVFAMQKHEAVFNSGITDQLK